MPESTTFKLRQTIAVHENDVRAARFIGNDRVVTASRDNTVKLTGANGTTQILISGSSFYNACTVNSSGSLVFVGNLKGEITAIHLNGNATPESQLYGGHLKNVTSLDVVKSANDTDRLASGSWDNTVRVWDSPMNVKTSVGHSQYVWDVKFIDEHHLLSASADKTVRYWNIETGETSKKSVGHTDVVRALLILSPTEALSASNDETIIKWDLASGKAVATWHGHASFVYSLARSTENLVVSSSEDKTVRIWDTNTGKTIQTIQLPSISQWCVASNKLGEFVVGSSDNTAHIFTSHVDRQASSDQQASFENAIKEATTAKSEKQNDLDESQIKDSSISQTPPEPSSEGKIVFVRNSGNPDKVEAHKASGGSWESLGEVISPDAQAKKDTTTPTTKSDYTFDVDIADGAPPLKSQFNRNENPYIVAEQFVMTHDLPSSYVDQIVKFIITNTGNQVSAAKPADNAEIPSALLYSQPVFIRSFQADALLRALDNIAKEKNEDLSKYDIQSQLSSLPSSSNSLVKVALESCQQWQGELRHLLPALDLLRIALADAQEIPFDSVWMQLLSAIDAQIPKHCMLAVRGVANLVGNSSYPIGSQSVNNNLVNASKLIEEAMTHTPELSKPFAVAVASSCLNSAVKALPSVQVQPLIVASAEKIAKSGDAEAFYRILLAIGLRTVVNEGGAYEASWFVDAPSEPRVTESLEIVIPRIK